MTEQLIREERLALDGLGQYIQTLIPSREVSLAFTACQLGKMWLGKVLQAMEVSNPYPESKNPNSLQVEKTADTYKVEDAWSSEDTKDFTQIQKIKWIRQQLDKVVNVLVWKKEYLDGYSSWKKDEEIILAIRTARERVIESGMWLGQELGKHR